MLDKIFNKKKKQQDIFSIPQRKTPVDLKNVPKLGPKALQQIVQQQQKYITLLITRIQQIKIQYHKIHDKSQQLKQKNQVINAQVHKMSNQHQELTIKFDNLQNSLQIMISTNQQQFNDQINFLKNNQSSLSSHQLFPKNIQQIFSLYKDRFVLCSKISQQNKFLKQKITDIELKFDEIKQRYEQAQKQKGYNSMIPQLMQSLQELKRQRKNSNSLPHKIQIVQNIEMQPKHIQSRQKTLLKQAQTMTSQQQIQSPKIKQAFTQFNNIHIIECANCKQLNLQIDSLINTKQSLMEQVGQWSEKYYNLQKTVTLLKQEKSKIDNQKNSLQKKIKSSNQQVQSLSKSIQKQSSNTQSFKLEITTLQTSIQNLRTENQILMKDIQTKSYQLSLKQAEVSNLELKLSQQIIDNKDQNQTSQQIVEQKNSVILVYEQKIKSLTAQNQSNLQQLLNLRQQIIVKCSEINKLNDSIQKVQTQLKKSQQSLIHSEQMTNQIEIKYQKLMDENEEQMMSKIHSLQAKTNENQKELVYLRNIKLNFEQQNKKLSKQKKIMEDTLKQLQTYKNDIQMRILPNLRAQLQSFKKQYQRINQQKQVIQQHSLDNINQLNINYQTLLKQKDTWTKQKSDLQMLISQLKRDNAQKSNQIQTFQQMINKLNQQMTDKLLTIQKINEDLKSKSTETQQLYEELRSKQRKYQSELNQQRIKLQTMKRTISVQQTKLQQNQKSSNKFYEESMHKDKKIAYMEVKLKEYKHLIQSLKKQKQQVEKSYRQKVKIYEQSIAQVVSEQQVTTQRKRGQQKGERKISQANGQNFTNDKDADYFKNEIVSYEQSNLVLTQQNATLRQQIKQLEEQLGDRKKQIQNLQQKRQQTLRQIQKLNLRSINGTIQQTSPQFLQKQKQFMKQKQEFEAYKQKSQQRMKKIALKAYKGFDILLKKHQNLYKQFMAVFVKQIEEREDVKGIQSQINLLVNKSTDMKDVFQDYL